MATSSSPLRAAPWAMLVARPILFAAFQVAIALVLVLAGSSTAWHSSAAWWLITVLLGNLVTVFLLAQLQRREGNRYWDLFYFDRSSVRKDLLLAILLFVLAAPISMLPNQWLARLLFGSEDAAFGLMFRALPTWAALLALLMPVSHGFAELPTYFAFSMPRLAERLGRPWLAWGIASFFLAFQHVAVPLIFDARYAVWRLGMFIPLAFFIGLCLKLRPRLLSYVVVGHALLDLPLAILVLTLSI